MRYALGWVLIAIPVLILLAGLIYDKGLGKVAILLAVSLVLAGMLMAGVLLLTP